SALSPSFPGSYTRCPSMNPKILLHTEHWNTWSTVFGTWAAVTTEMVCGSNPSVCAANRSCPPDATLIWPGFQWNVDWMSVFGSNELDPCGRTVSFDAPASPTVALRI